MASRSPEVRLPRRPHRDRSARRARRTTSTDSNHRPEHERRARRGFTPAHLIRPSPGGRFGTIHQDGAKDCTGKWTESKCAWNCNTRSRGPRRVVSSHAAGWPHNRCQKDRCWSWQGAAKPWRRPRCECSRSGTTLSWRPGHFPERVGRLEGNPHRQNLAARRDNREFRRRAPSQHRRPHRPRRRTATPAAAAPPATLPTTTQPGAPPPMVGLPEAVQPTTAPAAPPGTMMPQLPPAAMPAAAPPAVPGVTAPPAAPAAPGGSRVVEAQGKVADVRKLPIDPRLKEALEYAAAQTGTRVRVTSGGQPEPGHGRRTGSLRHDLGKAADFDLIDEKGNIIPRNDPRRLAFLEEAARAGAGGTGTGYMSDPLKIHAGITGKTGRVGEGLGPYAGSREEQAAVIRGLRRRLTPEELARERARQRGAAPRIEMPKAKATPVEPAKAAPSVEPERRIDDEVPTPKVDQGARPAEPKAKEAPSAEPERRRDDEIRTRECRPIS